LRIHPGTVEVHVRRAPDASVIHYIRGYG